MNITPTVEMKIDLFAKLRRQRAIYPGFLLAFLISVIQAGTVFGQIIPTNRVANWAPGVTVGVPGGIPTNRTNLIDVTKSPYNADSTGASDASAAIQSAIKAAASNQVVYLPAGTYLITNTLTVAHTAGANYGITIRGAGTNTVLNWTNAAGIYVGESSDYSWSWPTSSNNVTAGLAKGSTNITIADTSAFSPGEMILISYQDDTNLPVISVSSYRGGLRSQLTLLKSKTSTTLTFWPPIYSTCTNGAVVHVAQRQMNLFGLEDMVFNATGSTATYLIRFEQCYACWIKNVHTFDAYDYHVFLYNSLNCEVRHSYLDTLNHSGPNGGNLLMNCTSADLIEDNILTDGFPLVEVSFGSCGNVFGYNFLLNSESSGIIGASFDANHGAHNSYDLYEGNIASKFQSDGYWGSASELTVFRNWLNGTSPNTSQFAICVSLDRFTRNFNIVGNILGSTNYAYTYWNTNTGIGYSTPYIYTFGLPNMGNGAWSGSFAPPWASWAAWASAAPGSGPGAGGFQEIDTNVLATTLLAGNYNYADKAVNAAESLGTNTLPASLYQSAKPAWFGNLAWPPFNPANPNPANVLIPAGYRFVNNGADPPGVGSGTLSPPSGLILRSN